MSDGKIFRLRYVGTRFRGARMPVDVLPDLPAFRDLIVAYVKDGWREVHKDRARLPRGFVLGLKFDLIGIEDGSAIPAIQWDSDNAQLRLPEFRDEMEELVAGAYMRTIRLVEGAVSSASVVSLSSEELRAISRFGSGLQGDERIEFVGQNDPSGNVVYLDAYRRKCLLTRGRSSYVARFDSVGRLLGSGVDETNENGHIEISTEEHGVLWLAISPDRVRSEFDGKIAADVQFRLMIDLDETDKFLGVSEVLEIDLIDAKVMVDLERCRNRIGALASLSDGWHNGLGKAPSQDAVQSSFRLLARNPGLAASYSIFPTDEGGLLFEFKESGWDYTVEICQNGQVEIYGIETEGEGEMDTGTLGVDTEQFRAEFDRLAGGRW